MADRDSTAPRKSTRGPANKPLRREVMWWGILAEGTREQLVAAGIVPDELLPERGTVRVEIDGRAAKIVRASKYRFDVWIQWREDEREARERARQASEDLERASAAVRARIEALPTTHDDYRVQIEGLESFLGYVEHRISTPHGGFRLDADTVERVGVLIQAIRSTVAEGRSQFSQADRDEQVSAMRAELVAKDAPFAAFLGRLAP